jgi:hypothetical protein
MTFGALRGSTPVDANLLARDFPLFFMTLRALHVAMYGVQHEFRPIVLEAFPVPMHRDVALGAILLWTVHELTAVRVPGGMTSGAFNGCSGEMRCRPGWSGCIRFRRPMALDAFHVQVNALDPECVSGMIERTHCLPLLGRVAGLTGQFRLVRIGVTCVARSRSEMILARHRRYCHCCRRTVNRQRLMALRAIHRRVLAYQRKLRLRMPLQRKRSWLEACRYMAVAAFVRMRRGGELTAVAIRVAGRAFQFPGDEDRALALRLMTLPALQFVMFSFQRKRALPMRLTVKARGLEPSHVVTR